MEERIKQLAKEFKGDKEEVAKRIQTTLLWDTNNQVPLSFIKAHME